LLDDPSSIPPPKVIPEVKEIKVAPKIVAKPIGGSKTTVLGSSKPVTVAKTKMIPTKK
jgi:hypothetical protein